MYDAFFEMRTLNRILVVITCSMHIASDMKNNVPYETGGKILECCNGNSNTEIIIIIMCDTCENNDRKDNNNDVFML